MSSLQRQQLDRELLVLRQDLHRTPEPSHREVATAQRIRGFLEGVSPDAIVSGLGGHGLAAVFAGAHPGPTMLLRADMDAVAVTEQTGREHRSLNEGFSHACGHDGHSVILCGVAKALSKKRPLRGRVVLLFQPAEETGKGAKQVRADPQFAALRPDFAFALHNLPGYPLGQVLVREGAMAAASVAAQMELLGVTSHAAYPEQGRNPAYALAALIQAMKALNRDETDDEAIRLVTPVHAQLGERALGTSPGHATLIATIRAQSDDALMSLQNAVQDMLVNTACQHGLDHALSWLEQFPATHNTAHGVALVRAAATSCDLDLASMAPPLRGSEDFGWFLRDCEGALFCMGAGEDHPPLHSPAYDFPLAMLPLGVAVFNGLVQALLN